MEGEGEEVYNFRPAAGELSILIFDTYGNAGTFMIPLLCGAACITVIVSQASSTVCTVIRKMQPTALPRVVWMAGGFTSKRREPSRGRGQSAPG